MGFLNILNGVLKTVLDVAEAVKSSDTAVHERKYNSFDELPAEGKALHKRFVRAAIPLLTSDMDSLILGRVIEEFTVEVLNNDHDNIQIEYMIEFLPRYRGIRYNYGETLYNDVVREMYNLGL